MGGHQSKQSVAVSSDLVTNASMKMSQDCISFMDGSQVIAVNGSGNVVDGNVQESSMSVNSKCVAQLGEDGSFVNKLTDSVSQALKDEEIALSQWMDGSKDKQSTSIAENVTQNLTFEEAQKCLNTVQGTQVIMVKGTGNVVSDNLQEQSSQLVSNCLMSGSETAKSVNDVTNTINQHSTYKSDNPFSFITDAIEGVFRSAIAVAAVVFIAVVILVLVFEVGGRKKKKGGAPAPPVIVAPPLSPSELAGE